MKWVYICAEHTYRHFCMSIFIMLPLSIFFNWSDTNSKPDKGRCWVTCWNFSQMTLVLLSGIHWVSQSLSLKNNCNNCYKSNNLVNYTLENFKTSWWVHSLRGDLDWPKFCGVDGIDAVDGIVTSSSSNTIILVVHKRKVSLNVPPFCFFLYSLTNL